MKKYIINLIVLAGIIAGFVFTDYNSEAKIIHNNRIAQTTTLEKPAAAIKQPAGANNINAIKVSPITVVENPSMYLNKTITFDADFIAFSSLGLGYKPAFRDSAKYISILIKREDVQKHIIPLSEMKIFLTRELAEKNVDLEQGDKINIVGTVFSAALGDPWVDVKTLTVISSKEKKAE